MPIMLVYEFNRDQNNDNRASAKEATYSEVIARVQKDIKDCSDGEVILGELPRTAETIVYLNTNAEDWRGTMVVWGVSPKTPKVPNDTKTTLTVDGKPYKIGYLDE